MFRYHDCPNNLLREKMLILSQRVLYINTEQFPKYLCEENKKENQITPLPLLLDGHHLARVA